jgi:hypothetical protein
MKKYILISIAIVYISQVGFTQKNQLRSLNEVVFSLYKPLDKGKLNSKIPVALLHQDIDLYVKTIEEIGVNPYLNFHKDSFYYEINQLKRKIDKPLTRREFFLMFSPICHDLKLSHTEPKIDWWVYKDIFDKNGGTYLPIDIKIEGNNLIIDKDYSSKLPIGKEIVSINQIKSKTIIDSLLRYSNSSTNYSRKMDTQEDFSMLLWWIYNFSDTFLIELKDKVYTLKGMTVAELDKAKSNNSNQHKEYKQYEYKEIDSKTGLMTIRDFGIRDTNTYFHFLDSAFHQLKQRLIKNLIIDIRGNAGGNDNSFEVVRYLYDKPFKSSSKIYYKKSKIAEDFFLLFLNPEDRNNPETRKLVNCFGKCESEHQYGEYYECEEIKYIPKSDSLRFNGNLFVLQDFNTVSAGVDFAVLIKDFKIGKIIGTETNQSPSNDANGCYFLLPNTNILSVAATIYNIRPNGDPNTTRGVIPDYEIIQTKEDSEKGIDTIMDFTMKLIKKN